MRSFVEDKNVHESFKRASLKMPSFTSLGLYNVLLQLGICAKLGLHNANLEFQLSLVGKVRIVEINSKFAHV